MFGCFTFAKLDRFVKQNKKYFLFFTNQNLGAVAADFLDKSMLGLCLIISRAARYLPKPALNNIPSLFVYYDLYGGYNTVQVEQNLDIFDEIINR